jgi:iron complex outermembrane receptor protein
MIDSVPGGKLPAVRFAVAAVLYGVAGQPHAVAAEAPAEEAMQELDMIVVTGSHIQRTEMEKIVPITVIGEAAMEARNAVLPVDLLTSLPSVVNLPENETRLGSSGARGDNANLNLRGMGATATLILQDGRRMAVNPMTAGLSQAVNVNQLPTQGVERIEVLRDGASSIYGSDAVGGVINYVLKREMEGVEVSLRHDLTEAGGGAVMQGGLAFGTQFAGGRGRLFGSADLLDRDEVKLSDRSFSRSYTNILDRAEEGFDHPGGPFDARLDRGYFPTFRVGPATSNVFFRPVDGVPTLTTVAPTRTANPEFYLDLNQFGFASPRVRRWDGFLSGELDLTDNLTAFGDLSYYAAKSTMRRQPLALNAPGTDSLVVLSVDNPYNPYGSHFHDPAGDGITRLAGTPQPVSITRMTIADLAAETVVTDNNAIRATAGLRGRLGEGSWNWESSVFYNEVNGKDGATPNVRESFLQAAAARSGADAFNPFGYTFRIVDGAVVADQPYTNPQAVIDSFSETYRREARSYLASADVRANGTLFSWRGMDVQAAVGTEYRLEDLRDTRPPFHGENPADSGLDPTNNDFLLHPARPDVVGDRKVFSAYAELVLPLVSPERSLPLVHSFEVSTSARFEDYSDFGTTLKPKIGANWRPVSWLMLRGSYNEGFMAPSLAALYTSSRWSISTDGDLDIYRNPYTNEGRYTTRGYFGGNPDLKPQESKGVTFGLVLDVPRVSGLSVTADYWKIERTNLLGSRGTTQILENDAALLRAFTAQQVAAGIAPDSIDAGSGTAGYVGDPDIVRLPLTNDDRAAFAAWNAANPDNPAAPVGRIWSRNQPFVNLNSSEHRGVDFGVRYMLPRQNWGRLTLSSEASWLWRARNVNATGVAPVVENGMYAGGVARWRTTTNLSWDHAAWNADLGIYHVGKTVDSASVTAERYQELGRPGYVTAYHPTTTSTAYRRVIDPVVSANLSVGYRFAPQSAWLGDDTRVRLSIANLTDKAPPLATGGFGYNPGVSQSLLNGRTWSLQLTSQF